MDNRQFRATSDLHDPPELARLQRDVCNPSRHLERQCPIQLHGRLSWRVCGVSQTAYGAYGSATRTASYDLYTGTSTRTASTSTAYGKQSVGQAYNPYTGTYGATHQGSSPTAQWGQSYVSQGNKSAYTQHYSTANGTVASAQGSQGGKAYGTSSAYGNTAASKTSSGDMYAGHDGNVYKNTGSGWEKSNGSGGWRSVNTQQAQQQAQQNKSNYEQQHPNSQATAQSDKSSYEQVILPEVIPRRVSSLRDKAGRPAQRKVRTTKAAITVMADMAAEAAVGAEVAVGVM